MLRRPMMGPVAVLLALALAALPAAAQHDHGTTSHGDTVPLGPAGGGSDLATIALYAIGIDLGPGYTFQFSWSADNGTGPPVHFEIFAHSTALHLVYYSKNASQDSGAWRVPGSDVYYVSWANPSPAWVNVTYAFQGVPSSDMTLILAGATVFILAVVAYVAVAARRMARESADAASASEREASPEPARSDTSREDDPAPPQPR